jgi:hypothetical protein
MNQPDRQRFRHTRSSNVSLPSQTEQVASAIAPQRREQGKTSHECAHPLLQALALGDVDSRSIFQPATNGSMKRGMGEAGVPKSSIFRGYE